MKGRKLIYKDGLKKMHVMMPPAFWEALTTAAFKRNISRSKLIRKILSVFLEAELKRQPTSVIHDDEEFFKEDESEEENEVETG